MRLLGSTFRIQTRHHIGNTVKVYSRTDICIEMELFVKNVLADYTVYILYIYQHCGTILKVNCLKITCNYNLYRSCYRDARKSTVYNVKTVGTDPVLKINNHATGGWRTKDILGGPKSLETKKLGSSKG